MTKFKNFFTSADFQIDQNSPAGRLAFRFGAGFDTVNIHDAAEIANTKLERLISEWPVIDFLWPEGAEIKYWARSNKPTHCARLAFIQPIKEISDYCEAKITIDKEKFVEETKKLVDKAIGEAWKRLKEPCKHEPGDRIVQMLDPGRNWKTKCRRCGVELKAKWESVK
jgi:hypothetical protein